MIHQFLQQNPQVLSIQNLFYKLKNSIKLRTHHFSVVKTFASWLDGSFAIHHPFHHERNSLKIDEEKHSFTFYSHYFAFWIVICSVRHISFDENGYLLNYYMYLWNEKRKIICHFVYVCVCASSSIHLIRWYRIMVRVNLNLNWKWLNGLSLSKKKKWEEKYRKMDCFAILLVSLEKCFRNKISITGV